MIVKVVVLDRSYQPPRGQLPKMPPSGHTSGVLPLTRRGQERAPWGRPHEAKVDTLRWTIPQIEGHCRPPGKLYRVPFSMTCRRELEERIEHAASPDFWTLHLICLRVGVAKYIANSWIIFKWSNRIEKKYKTRVAAGLRNRFIDSIDHIYIWRRRNCFCVK